MTCKPDLSFIECFLGRELHLLYDKYTCFSSQLFLRKSGVSRTFDLQATESGSRQRIQDPKRNAYSHREEGDKSLNRRQCAKVRHRHRLSKSSLKLSAVLANRYTVHALFIAVSRYVVETTYVFSPYLNNAMPRDLISCMDT